MTIARLFMTALAGCGLVLPSTVMAQDANCGLSARRVGDCFPVHGRLSFSETAPEIRLWPAGTHRVLGILSWDGKEDHALSEAMLERMWGGQDLPGRIWGDFEVCPLSPDQPGRMQMVCLMSARNLFVDRPRRDQGPAQAAAPPPAPAPAATAPATTAEAPP